jgi:hypothetical protein
MWGVALAALVEENPEKLTERLDDLLTGRMSDEGRNDIIFTLLRLGYRPAATRCFNYVKDGLRRTGQPSVLSLLAASCRVDPEECLTLSSNYFGRVLRSEEAADENRGSISAFVSHFMAVDERLLGKLVERTKTVNIDAGKRLATLLDEYLTKPWNVREFGEAKVGALREQIHAAGAT